MLSPTPRNPAASCLGGLMMVATITLGTPSLCSIRAFPGETGAREASQDPGKPANPDGEPKRDLEAFLETYRLAPGQDLKHIPPPRPAGFGAWFEKNAPGAGRQDVICAMSFGWRDPDRLRWRTAMYGSREGWTIRELPQCMGMGIELWEVEGDADLLKTRVSGDWIIREGVPTERLIPHLEAILQRAIRQRITLALRAVERDVVVARGRYRPSPFPGHAAGEIEIYAREIIKDDDRTTGAGGFSNFLNGIGQWIGRPIVNEVESPPKGNISWSYTEREPSTEQTRREDRDEVMVLKRLQEQTALTFTREKRPMRILFVERPKPTRRP